MTTGNMAAKRLHEQKGSRGHSKKERPGGTKKADRTVSKVFHGWDLPLLQDENDIVSWMKREKNGDNRRKPRPNEDLPEETYRHDFIRCRNVDDQMEFERESLHERYRKNCQVGAKPMEIKNSSNLKKQKDDEIVEPLPARKLRFPRSCKSAELPTTPKISTLQQSGLGFPDSEITTPIVLSRSHSVIDDTRLKSYGLTLPPDVKTLRLLELAEKFTSKGDSPRRMGRVQEGTASLEETVDEGYDSKVSSNDIDAEDDTEGSRVAQFDGASVYNNLDRVPPEQALDTSSQHNEEDGEDHDKFQQFVTQNLARKLLSGGANDNTNRDSIAKLIYSRRDLNVYERSPSRRKDTSFKYAGKEQSRLMETSLSNITPGYLNMHQLANMTSLSQETGSQIQADNENQLQMLFKHYAQQHHGPTHHHHNHLLHHHHHHNHHHHHSHHQQLHHPYNHNLNQHQISNNTNNNIKNNGNFHDKQHQSLTKPVPHHLLHENVDQKQLALRRICLQDAAGKDVINSHTLIDNQENISAQNASSGCLNKQHRVKSVASIKDDSEMQNSFKAPVHDGASSVDEKTRTKEIGHTDHVNKTHLLRVQDMSSKISLPNKSRVQGRHTTHNSPNVETPESLTPSPCQNNNSNVKDTPSSERENVATSSNNNNNNNHHHNNVSSVLIKYFNKKSPNNHTDNSKMDDKGLSSTNQGGTNTSGNTPHTGDRVSPSTFFPVADLLPAVENNLRRRKKRGLGKQTSLMYRSHTMLDSNLWMKEAITAATGGEPPSFATSHPDLSNNSTTSGMIFDELTKAVFKTDRNPVGMQKGCGPPKFRPHVALSPLQRAKEIASRRIHGYLAKYPDGPEHTRVTSPQYLSSKIDRISSASRRLGHMMNATWK